ncbi:LysR family transcriptional regulator [Bacillus altitudinis]|jgi:DNA-binding transcriptional LysR family regulator|uniref:LysR family transcriptional regulator n=1 Tax=Bacillus altitudinis TaxID=293387 RepID=UPI0002DB0C90|nr:LysR family transcriptional regulator [Bacillus altitudinis]MBX7000854.1 LysR family transcriptional regulator [Bacillus aerophilus]MBX7015871.1 LysR family transcriptional regulator [Bacillus aerophilus]MCY7452046.1 LysR family transcriptional regulator [Bacillus altitudinis]OPX00775.1 LysR family transcriptional regulator [Bacillus altitudinis]PJI13751.1 LysR family transcriptional regulator [Bacillus altitudinis]
MEIRAIRTFATIVKYGNFLKAAEALNYSQPTITLHIKHLEEEIGEKLLERGKTLKLTASGQLFYERANSLLNEYEKLTKTLQDLEVGIAGFIRIGVSEPTASLEFPALIAEFKERFPNVEFSVQVADANTLSSLLSHDEIDFAICGAPEASMENSYKPLFQDDIVLLVPSSHRLAEKGVVEVTDLKDETILFTPHNCPIRIQIEQQIVDVIGTNYNKLEITSSMSHKHYVQAGLGVSLFTRTAHSFTLPGTKVLEIKGIHVSPPVGLLRKTNDSPGRAVLQFIDLIENRLRQPT